MKIKCWDIGEFELVGVHRQPGKRSEALLARGRQICRQSRDRHKQRDQGTALEARPAGQGPAPGGLATAVVTPDVEWVRPGINMRVKTLRGEPKLRHASVQDFREE